MGVEVNIRMELPEDVAAHLSNATGDFGDFDSVEAYVRDLIRRDMEEMAIIESHMPILRQAFAEPDSSYVPFDADDFRERMKRKHG